MVIDISQYQFSNNNKKHRLTGWLRKQNLPFHLEERSLLSKMEGKALPLWAFPQQHPWVYLSSICGHISATSMGVPQQSPWVYLSSIHGYTSAASVGIPQHHPWVYLSGINGYTSASSVGIPQQHQWVYLNNVRSYTLKLPVGASKPCSGKRTAHRELFIQSSGQGPQHWVVGLKWILHPQSFLVGCITETSEATSWLASPSQGGRLQSPCP